METKNTQNHENRRLGLIESLHMQHCRLPPSAGLSGIRFSKQSGWAHLSKEIEYNLHSDDVRGDFLRHNTSYSKVLRKFINRLDGLQKALKSINYEF